MSETVAATCNKTELADLLGVSVPTLDAWIKKKPGFPIVTRGNNGVPWEFNPAAVTAFIADQRAAAAAAGAQRDETLEQFKLPVVTDQEKGVSPADLVKLAQLRKLEREEQIATGFLVPAAQVRALMFDTLAQLRRTMNTAITQALADHNVPESTVRSVMARVEDAQRVCVQTLQAGLQDGSPDAAEAQPALL